MDRFIVGIVDDKMDRTSNIITGCYEHSYHTAYENALHSAKSLIPSDREVIITTERYMDCRTSEQPELYSLWSNRDPELVRRRYFRYDTDEWKSLTSRTDNRSHSYKQSVYFDMDGTLCRWYPDLKGFSSIEEITDPLNHYFRDNEPYGFAVELANTLHDADYDVCIISASARETIRDKVLWIERHMPFMPEENIFFAPIGADKTEFIKGNADISVLIDDYVKNLCSWTGSAIKARNDINTHQDKYPEIDVTGQNKIIRPNKNDYISTTCDIINKALKAAIKTANAV